MTFEDLRNKSNKTAQKVAKELHLKEGTYKKYEYSMRLPSSSILTQMPGVYQCSADDVMNAYNNSKEVQIKKYGKTNP